MAVYGYTRASTLEQAERGYSLDGQMQRIDEWAARQGVKVAAYFTDGGVSATNKDVLDRPASRKLIETIKPGDYIVVTKWDRLFRSVADGARYIKTWADTNIGMVILDFGGMALDLKSATGRAILHIQSAFAEMEGGIKGDRIRDAHAVRRAMGLAGTSAYAPIGLTFRIVSTRIGRKLRYDLHPKMWPVVEEIRKELLKVRKGRRNKITSLVERLRKEHPLLVTKRIVMGNPQHPAWRLLDEPRVWTNWEVCRCLDGYERRLAFASQGWEHVLGDVESQRAVGVVDGIDRKGYWPTKAPGVMKLPRDCRGRIIAHQIKPAPAWVLQARAERKQ